MLKINLLNVAKFLLYDISLNYTKQSSINTKEIEIMDHFLGKCCYNQIRDRRKMIVTTSEEHNNIRIQFIKTFYSHFYR